MATEQIKNPILIEILKENREKLNSLFGIYKLNYPAIEKDILFFYLVFMVEPLFEKNQNLKKETLTSTFLILYEKLLEMIGKNLLGNSGRYPFFENKIILCLENSGKWIFEDPENFISSTANAILNIGNITPKGLEKWTSFYLKILKTANSLNEIFLAGKVAAWLSGMAQYRNESLQIMRQIDINLLEILVGNSNVRHLNREKMIDRLEKDPWLDLENAIKENSGNRKIRVSRISGFTGLGGHFISPPKVEYLEDHFIVNDGVNYYILFLDIFGSFLLRISFEFYNELKKKSFVNKEISISKEGLVQFANHSISYPPLKNYSHSASSQSTICATSPYSYTIYAIGLRND
ncbi:MAG TPA: hypothetical protein PK079_05920 [Leptospiraceae bacterium]|nr:hypothetical protein [Leptospiraceae bacterium]HMW05714.1 hypothetical protein [Leptospiraceae bacterium]HMX34162.1 hypothetical protein [Leptospiraceae bacterium]HMY30253.1 hypothetical protein [Leptospiraceae bacterium]HMZ66142.1 hypothetical protein [Leptospiraceae bacterium]